VAQEGGIHFTRIGISTEQKNAEIFVQIIPGASQVPSAPTGDWWRKGGDHGSHETGLLQKKKHHFTDIGISKKNQKKLLILPPEQEQQAQCQDARQPLQSRAGPTTTPLCLRQRSGSWHSALPSPHRPRGRSSCGTPRPWRFERSEVAVSSASRELLSGLCFK